MRLTKSLLSVIAALALGAGSAFAGGGTMSQSSDAEIWSGWSSSESSSFPMNSSESMQSMQPDSESLAESDVIYIYPMQVTEYYVLVPSVDTEIAAGGG